MSKFPLLITSSVVPSDTTGRLNNPQLRLEHTLESLDYWVNHHDKINIVICDGSNYDFSDIVQARYPNINIECLRFHNNIEKVNHLGKGYGEGEIIHYALLNSKEISLASCFIKCTAKLWVINFEECLRQWNGVFLGKAHFDHILSWRKTQYGYFDTRFYMADIDFYAKHLQHIHCIPNQGNRVHIEDSFTQVLRGLGQKKYLFRVPPIISGVQGASAKYYKSSMRRQLKDKLKNFIVMHNPNFKDLFVDNV